MKKEIKGNEILFTANNIDDLYTLVNKLNKERIPYKSYCGVLISLAYYDWLNSNI